MITKDEAARALQDAAWQEDTANPSYRLRAAVLEAPSLTLTEFDGKKHFFRAACYVGGTQVWRGQDFVKLADAVEYLNANERASMAAWAEEQES